MRTRLNLIVMVVLGLAVSFNSCKNDPKTEPKPEQPNQYSYKIGTTVYTVDKEKKEVTVKDNGEGTGTTTWSKDTTYILDGLVFVNDGSELTINAGTMIQGKPGQGENSSAMVVAMGGKITAKGTISEPIVFTGLGDTYTGEAGYPVKTRGVWGGLIMLGKATTSNSVQKHIEGISESESRGIYGGSDDSDNSGTLTYISIRHGGTEIGSGNEINGLTLGAVGAGTVMNHIEIIANLDDGIEFFGGAAQLKNVLVSYVGDDSFDYDEGFHGKGQFWVALQDETTGDRCAEQDGGSHDDETAKPYSTPVLYNVTYIGHGGKLMIFRDNAGGHYANSIFANVETGMRIEYRNDKDNSYDRFKAGDLTAKNNILQDLTDGNPMFVKPETDKGPEPADADANVLAHWNDNGNKQADLGLVGDEGTINLIPTTGANSGVAATDSWFDAVTYQGALENGGTDWTAGWTLTFL